MTSNRCVRLQRGPDPLRLAGHNFKTASYCHPTVNARVPPLAIRCSSTLKKSIQWQHRMLPEENCDPTKTSDRLTTERMWSIRDETHPASIAASTGSCQRTSPRGTAKDTRSGSHQLLGFRWLWYYYYEEKAQIPVKHPIDGQMNPRELHKSCTSSTSVEILRASTVGSPFLSPAVHSRNLHLQIWISVHKHYRHFN